jgi:hypothetical protein
MTPQEAAGALGRAFAAGMKAAVETRIPVEETAKRRADLITKAFTGERDTLSRMKATAGVLDEAYWDGFTAGGLAAADGFQAMIIALQANPGLGVAQTLDQETMVRIMTEAAYP